MSTVSWVLFAVVAVGLVFDYTNGFHDSANAIATSIGTRALSPTVALAMAATLNVVGGIIFETKVADTMTGIVSHSVASQDLVLAALVGAIIWNIFTWYFGIPSSSSHALIGGLVGAAIGAAVAAEGAGAFAEVTAKDRVIHWGSVWQKVILPTIASPIIGLLAAIMVTTIFYRLVNGGTDAFEKLLVRSVAFLILAAFFAFILNLVIGRPYAFLKGVAPDAPAAISPYLFLIPAAPLAIWLMSRVIGQGPAVVNGNFRHLQTASAGFMALEHGHNDAQKTMGIITLALIAAGQVDAKQGVPLWVKLACAGVMGLGTFTGGKRIIRTMGMKLVKLEPIDGFAAETVAGSVIQVAGSYGMPISTTHAVTAAITGVGATKRLSSVHWGVTGQILTAWVLTLPAAALLAGVAFAILHAVPH
jgi:PiT family inorganic phosphate transporter